MSEYTIFLLLILKVCFISSEENKAGSAALENFPIIDGHNDFPNNLYLLVRDRIQNVSFDQDLSQDPIFGTKACNSCYTDLPRLRKGHIGAQFWAAYVDCNKQENFQERAIEQIFVIHQLVKKYSDQMQLATSSAEIIAAINAKKIASLIGVEGGHSIMGELDVLGLYYERGARYLTLTHTCNLFWADSSTVDAPGSSPIVNLTDFGKQVVLEMNRLGMMVDLSHVSHNVMVEALDTSLAPVIFSHSSVYALVDHPRNVRDDVLLMLKENNGIIMVNFFSDFVAKSNATIRDVADHINYIVDKIGHDFVGIGADYDGVESMPEGLEDVSKYPNLFDLLKELNSTRWTLPNLEKLAGTNFIRVFQEVEKVRDNLGHKTVNE